MISYITIKDRIRSDYMHEKLPIENKRKSRTRWFQLVKQRPITATVGNGSITKGPIRTRIWP